MQVIGGEWLMQHKSRAIAILGGMGPEASVYMYKLLIERAVSHFGAKNNDDFPEIVLYSVPVPDFISNDKSKKKALNMLIEKVKQLNKLNIANLSIACNTAHVLLNELQNNTIIPFISMIKEVTDRVENEGITKVGILGTPSTIKSELYQKALSKKGIESVIPSDGQIKILELVIRNVIAGKILRTDAKKLIHIANFLRKMGAEGIILGCTELPLVFPKKYSLPVYNSVEILSLELLRRYYQTN